MSDEEVMTAQLERMHEDLATLCKTWREAGIDPITIGARLVRTGSLIASMLEVPSESVIKVVLNVYGELPTTRPTAKA